MGLLKPKNPKPCAWVECQELFVPARAGQLYCSPECRKAKFRKDYRKGLLLRECGQCSKPLHTKNPMKRFCTIKCQKAFANGLPRKNYANALDTLEPVVLESIQRKLVQKRKIEQHQEFDGNSNHAQEIEAYLAKGKKITKLSIESTGTSKPVRLNDIVNNQGILY